MITRERLAEVYTYEQDTGEFVRNYSAGGAKKGSKASSAYPNGYMRVLIDGKHYMAHRLAMLWLSGEMPECDVDHIDHDRKNNRWWNLRLVSRTDNMRNAKLSAANSSGFTGVTWDKVNNKWTAQVMVDGKSLKLGRFFCKIDAIAERMRANIKYGFHENHGTTSA